MKHRKCFAFSNKVISPRRHDLSRRKRTDSSLAIHFAEKQISTRMGADLFWLNPHEVIQSRDSKRVGAGGCMENNPEKECKKCEICLHKRSVFAFIFC